MKLRLGDVRRLVREAVSSTNTTTPSAPTDADAAIPGHLPEELPPSIGSIDEEAWVPGRWMPNSSSPVDSDDVDRLGSPDGIGSIPVDEADARVEGDSEDEGMSKHLRDHETLGEPGENDAP